VKPIPLTPETSEVARRIVWFEEPERALADPIRFMAYAMTYARHEDMRVIQQYVSDDEFRQALDRAPPGIIDPRSWAYWNLRVGRFPPPPLPSRSFGNSSPVTSASRMSPEERRRVAAEAWRKIREQGTTDDPEEIRHRASQEWFEKYGPGKKRSD
jgi:hypothetical protein